MNKSKLLISAFIYSLVFIFSFFINKYNEKFTEFLLPLELDRSYQILFVILFSGFLFNLFFSVIFLKNIKLNFSPIYFINSIFFITGSSFFAGCMLWAFSNSFNEYFLFSLILPPSILMHIYAFYYVLSDTINLILSPFGIQLKFRNFKNLKFKQNI